MVASLLGLDAPPASDHAADALALAICHAYNDSARGVRAQAQNTNT
jgi:Holliday junction resolvasome RuvABC endonuclease subunit